MFLLCRKTLFLIITLISSLALISIAPSVLAAKETKEKKLEPTVTDVEDPTKPIVCAPSETKWANAPETLPLGAKMALVEGNPIHPGVFTMRLKLPPNYSIPAHWNSYDEHITVISGALNLGMGDALDTTKGKTLPEGSFIRIPAKMHHFAWTGDQETIIQLHGMGPWGLFYVDQAQGLGTVDSQGQGQAQKPQSEYDEPLTKN